MQYTHFPHFVTRNKNIDILKSGITLETFNRASQ